MKVSATTPRAIDNRRNLRVGLTGGIGSGKSEVGKVFADLGAFLIDADLLAREAVVPGTEGLRRIFQRWPLVERADGTLDREALAYIVFQHPEERGVLIGIVHPIVRELTKLRMRDARPGQVIVHEVPLLFEADLHGEMDITILVLAAWEQRVERVMARSGWSREQVVQRMAAQIQPEEAAKLATITLHNDGDLAQLQAKAKQIFAEIQHSVARDS